MQVLIQEVWGGVRFCISNKLLVMLMLPVHSQAPSLPISR